MSTSPDIATMTPIDSLLADRLEAGRVRISARWLTRTQIIVFVGARYKYVRIQVLS